MSNIHGLSNIANQCFSVDPNCQTHEVGAFGQRPNQDNINTITMDNTPIPGR